VSKISEKAMQEVKTWQNIPSEAAYSKSRMRRCIVRQIRSPTKHVSYKNIKQNDSPLRMLYLTTQRISKHWRTSYQNWNFVLNQLDISRADSQANFFFG